MVWKYKTDNKTFFIMYKKHQEMFRDWQQYTDILGNISIKYNKLLSYIDKHSNTMPLSVLVYVRKYKTYTYTQKVR